MSSEPKANYRAREGVFISVTERPIGGLEMDGVRVTGKVDALRAFILEQDLGPMAWIHIGPDLLSAVFTPARAERIKAWLAENDFMDEDYFHDLRAESGA